MVLPSETTELPSEHDNSGDFDQLYTPHASEYEKEYEHFINFKDGEIIKF